MFFNISLKINKLSQIFFMGKISFDVNIFRKKWEEKKPDYPLGLSGQHHEELIRLYSFEYDPEFYK